MYELGCTTPEVEENIAELIEKDVLNEERFARAIARGKFNMKQWGKRKIIEQLKFQQVFIIVNLCQRLFDAIF